ncbi:hypothetical protein PPERSA_08157 [Pseudocohnilembus persalinus]|uniref:Actin family n=1 Tax=Pseudocohnilembus persalinus TaxID=266149 RepID=A0A0V0R3K1_PSEPJ|nr:hypothetical protein PPERSA_08157 [Pseudocohnilembus persalinus]|eukprot:KRX08954.1 hypothetical protein PPERSA_08157 [Pseudocohnilembus persalinus]
MFTEDITAIVVDPGSLNLRAGYSGEDNPRIVSPSQVGIREIIEQVENSEIQEEIKKKQYLAGDNALCSVKENMDVEHTYFQGKIVNEDGFVALLQHVYDVTRSNASDYCLLMSESNMVIDQGKQDQKQRELMTELAFEKLGVPNFFLAKSAVLSAFSSGRQNALVLDTGGYSTFAVPVFDGYSLKKSIIKANIGGEFLTEKLLNHVEQEKKQEIVPRYRLEFDNSQQPKKVSSILDLPNIRPSFDKYQKLLVARDIKETVCKVDDKNLSLQERELDRNNYPLPDGNFLHIDSASTEYSEFFFTRQRVNEQDKNGDPYIPQEFQEGDLLHFKGMQNMVVDSINSCDIDIRKELFQNIVVTGGNSLLNGFCSRLTQKLTDVAPQNSRVKMIAYPSSTERKFSSWIGGSILASLGSFQSMWVSKQEYQEQGVSIIDKKFP